MRETLKRWVVLKDIIGNPPKQGAGHQHSTDTVMMRDMLLLACF